MNNTNNEINSKRILESLIAKGKIFLSSDKLGEILSFSEIKFEKNTLISDFIRLLNIDNYIIVQEKTDKSEIALHLFQDKKQAMTFINGRLDVYEKMWDGCGCKVRYYD